MQLGFQIFLSNTRNSSIIIWFHVFYLIESNDNERVSLEASITAIYDYVTVQTIVESRKASTLDQNRSDFNYRSAFHLFLKICLFLFIYLIMNIQHTADHAKNKDFFGLVWFLLFNGISTLFSLFNAKAILLEEQ